jgi:KaiC/GvpD/RAD55 family RecA-like ATPase
MSTGVPGLDSILNGGLPAGRTYLVQGEPGVGKTTLGMQFLLEGVRRGERGIYVALSESEDELRDIALSHGWDLSGLEIVEIHSTDYSLKADSQYTFFHPSEVELSETTRFILDVVEGVDPVRVVFDSLSEMRLLARDSLRYRRQLLSLKHYFSERGCTVMLLDVQDTRSGGNDFKLETLAHGFLLLEQLSPEYGEQRRRMRVGKLRGLDFQEGYRGLLERARDLRRGRELFGQALSRRRAWFESRGRSSRGRRTRAGGRGFRPRRRWRAKGEWRERRGSRPPCPSKRRRCSSPFREGGGRVLREPPRSAVRA